MKRKNKLWQKQKFLTVIKNIGFEERKINEDLCKFRKAKDRKQSTIITFKSYSFRTSVYASRSNIQDREKIKLKLSLTKRRKKIINYAHTVTEPVPGVTFAYVDVNGNLKIRLHEQTEGKYMIPVNSIENLNDIFRKFDWTLPNNNVSDEKDV